MAVSVFFRPALWAMVLVFQISAANAAERLIRLDFELKLTEFSSPGPSGLASTGYLIVGFDDAPVIDPSELIENSTIPATSGELFLDGVKPSDYGTGGNKWVFANDGFTESLGFYLTFSQGWAPYGGQLLAFHFVGNAVPGMSFSSPYDLAIFNAAHLDADRSDSHLRVERTTGAGYYGWEYRASVTSFREVGAVPEPTALALISGGLAIICGLRRRTITFRTDK